MTQYTVLDVWAKGDNGGCVIGILIGGLKQKKND